MDTMGRITPREIHLKFETDRNHDQHRKTLKKENREHHHARHLRGQYVFPHTTITPTIASCGLTIRDEFYVDTDVPITATREMGIRQAVTE